MKRDHHPLLGKIAVRPEGAAATLSMSLSSFNRLVKEGKIRPPIRVPGTNIVLYDCRKLTEDWQAIQDQCASEEPNEWDEVLPQ